jgi:hypothetical protein
MSSEEIQYYAQRASIERSRAQDAPTPEIAAIHEKLADMYESLVGRLAQSFGVQDVKAAPHPRLQERNETLQ